MSARLIEPKPLIIFVGPREYTEDGATFVCLGVSNSGGGQGFLTRQVSSKAHVSHTTATGEVWIFPSIYPRLTGFRYGKNVDYHFSAGQSMQDSIATAIYNLLCTSISPDCVQPSHINCDNLFGRP